MNATMPFLTEIMRCRGPVCFVGSDLLAVNGRGMRTLPLVERKKMLREIVPQESRCILFGKHIARRGRELDRCQVEGRALQPGCTTPLMD